MFDVQNLLGQLMQSGVSQSGSNRMRHALGEKGLGGSEGMLSGFLGGRPGSSGAGLGGIAQMAKQFLGGGTGGGGSRIAVGGLGALAGALLGGGGGTMTGALGGGVMALLGSLAVSAVKNMNRPVAPNEERMMPLGLREPQDEGEEKQLQDQALLVLRAMINAAKADGQIDQDEGQRIIGQLQKAGADDEARDFVLQEMGKPMDLNGIIRDVANEELGAQVYAASLLAIEVDTPAEQDYMQSLAEGLGLGSATVARIHQALGVALFR